MIWANLAKVGAAWLYNKATLNYDSPTDPDSGAEIRYDSTGAATEWENKNK